MMKIRRYIVFFLLLSLLSSCGLLYRKQQQEVVAEVDGLYLTETDLSSITQGLSLEDSVYVATEFIRQWAMDVLEYAHATERSSEDIEKLVEDYRRSLYVHRYEENLIQKRMPKSIDDAVVDSFYEAHRDKLTLRESIVRGLLLVVPNDAPRLETIKKDLAGWKLGEQMDIENYAYQYARGYEYFADDWKTESQLLLSMPFEQNDLHQQLRQRSQICLSDSTTTYILQVVDKHLQGEAMPIDYARADIEKVILSRRQVEFLKEERQKMLDKALLIQRLHLRDDVDLENCKTDTIE